MVEENFSAPELPSVEIAKQRAEELLEAKTRRIEQFLKEVEPYLTKEEEQAKQQLSQELAGAAPPPAAQQKIQKHTEKIQGLPLKVKLERLVELAFEEGPLVAVRVAQRLNDAFLLDALHDTLAKDKLYEKLKQMGKV